jgi:DUF4097 and DUF4098 domain-containing protein YvlB
VTTTRNQAVALLLVLTGATAVLTGCKHFGRRYHDQSSITEMDTRSDSGGVNIHKMGGEIDVDDAPQGATLTTMGGDIHLGSVAGFAHLKTMGGNINIDHASGPVDATTMGGDVSARLLGSADGSNSARSDIHLTSNGGSITLTVPKDFPMEIHVTLAYTKNAPRSYRIVNDLGLSPHTSSDDWDTSHGSPRKYIRSEGRVGSGLNHVEIKTVNGDVILKQE